MVIDSPRLRRPKFLLPQSFVVVGRHKTSNAALIADHDSTPAAQAFQSTSRAREDKIGVDKLSLWVARTAGRSWYPIASNAIPNCSHATRSWGTATALPNAIARSWLLHQRARPRRNARQIDRIRHENDARGVYSFSMNQTIAAGLVHGQ